MANLIDMILAADIGGSTRNGHTGNKGQRICYLILTSMHDLRLFCNSCRTLAAIACQTTWISYSAHSYVYFCTKKWSGRILFPELAMSHFRCQTELSDPATDFPRVTWMITGYSGYFLFCYGWRVLNREKESYGYSYSHRRKKPAIECLKYWPDDVMVNTAEVTEDEKIWLPPDQIRYRDPCTYRTVAYYRLPPYKHVTTSYYRVHHTATSPTRQIGILLNCDQCSFQ